MSEGPNRTPLSEKSLHVLLSSLGVDFKINDRKAIAPYELDVLFPSYGIAIEVNGLKWHASRRKGKLYHSSKTDLCNEAGIDLLHIFSPAIEDPITVSIIKSKLGCFDKKYHARKTRVDTIDLEEYNAFCDENHLRGGDSAKIRLGLIDRNDGLVAVMGFVKKGRLFDMSRFCNKRCTTVRGGAKKLFKRFVTTHLQLHESVVSSCDRALFRGSMFLSLGFVQTKSISPRSRWLSNDGAVYDDPQSAKDSGKKCTKVYDAGQLLFTYTRDV